MDSSFFVSDLLDDHMENNHLKVFANLHVMDFKMNCVVRDIHASTTIKSE